MKIKLLTYHEQIGEIYLNLPVLFKTPHSRITSHAIIDTGSPRTILSLSDALRLQIPINSLSKSEMIRIGGIGHEGLIFNKLTISLKDENGEIVNENMPITIIKPTSPKEQEEALQLPTIFGTDLLKDKRYKLFCDIAGGIAYLERD